MSTQSQESKAGKGKEDDQCHWSMNLHCPICLELFYYPRVLGCGHSFCEKCLERMITQKQVEFPRAPIGQLSIDCPLCRFTVNCARFRWNGNVPYNRALEKIITDWIKSSDNKCYNGWCKGCKHASSAKLSAQELQEQSKGTDTQDLGVGEDAGTQTEDSHVLTAYIRDSLHRLQHYTEGDDADHHGLSPRPRVLLQPSSEEALISTYTVSHQATQVGEGEEGAASPDETESGSPLALTESPPPPEGTEPDSQPAPESEVSGVVGSEEQHSVSEDGGERLSAALGIASNEVVSGRAGTAGEQAARGGLEEGEDSDDEVDLHVDLSRNVAGNWNGFELQPEVIDYSDLEGTDEEYEDPLEHPDQLPLHAADINEANAQPAPASQTYHWRWGGETQPQLPTPPHTTREELRQQVRETIEGDGSRVGQVVRGVWVISLAICIKILLTIMYWSTGKKYRVNPITLLKDMLQTLQTIIELIKSFCKGCLAGLLIIFALVALQLTYSYGILGAYVEFMWLFGKGYVGVINDNMMGHITMANGGLNCTIDLASCHKVSCK